VSQPAAFYEIRFTGDALRDVESLDRSIRAKLKKLLEKKISVDPEGYEIPLRAPLSGYWKHPFGGHRLIYRIYPETRLVVVCAVGARTAADAEDVYAQLLAVARTGKLAEQVAAALQRLLQGKKKSPPPGS
jgi:mRNA-degrading endonuclease RelE of RelBE toxin-antitoxin system